MLLFELKPEYISLPKVECLHVRVWIEETDSPRCGYDALLRCYESRTRGVQVQTFHFLVSSMLINVYLNILFSDRGQRFVQRSSSGGGRGGGGHVLHDDI